MTVLMSRENLKWIIQAPNLTYKQLFFFFYVEPLEFMMLIFFGNPYLSIRKRQDWILWLTILKDQRKNQYLRVYGIEYELILSQHQRLI
jgi:hypothetical protein